MSRRSIAGLRTSWLLARSMTPSEPPSRAILEHWTAKEAYLKALGTGLYAPPPLVALPPSAPEPGTPATVVPDALSGGLVFARLALRGYVAGVVFEAGVARLRCLLYAPTSAPSYGRSLGRSGRP